MGKNIHKQKCYSCFTDRTSMTNEDLKKNPYIKIYLKITLS